MTKKPATGTETSSEKDPLIGKQLGDYRLTSILATGGMARIYKGMDYKLQRQAAVKVLAQEEIGDDKTLTKRFQREARAVAALEHDNIITIYQYGEQEGVYFLAMKLVKGKDLAQELKRLKKAGQRMDVQRAIRIMEQVASALDAAHAADVVHRDIKPSNILLDDDDKAILTDFGLVLRTSVETTMGTAFGTPRYIAPEQAISSNKAVPQSDIYSLGIIVYEILVGDTPFTGESPMEIALSHISDPPPPPRSLNKTIPEAVEREVLKSLEKEPEKRHRTAKEFVNAIKKGYGMTDGSVASAPSIASVSVPEPVIAKPVANSSAKSVADSWTMPETPAKADSKASTARPVRTAKTPSGEKPKGRSPLLLLLLLIVVAGGAAVFLLNGGLQGSNASGLTLGEDNAQVLLIYNDSAISMINTGDYDLNVRQLQFVRGVANDGGDDFNAERISRDTLPAGACARLATQNKQTPRPPQCPESYWQENLLDQTLYFWRKETRSSGDIASFKVLYKGNEIASCDTIVRAGSGECRFTWPEPPPTPTPET